MLQKLLENFFRVVLEVSMLKTWLEKFFEADLKVLTYFPNLEGELCPVTHPEIC